MDLRGPLYMALWAVPFILIWAGYMWWYRGCPMPRWRKRPTTPSEKPKAPLSDTDLWERLGIELPAVSMPAPASTPVTAPTITSAQWTTQISSQPDRVPHVAVLGPSGAGKSTLMQALAAQREGLLIVIQPNRRAGEWSGLPTVECADDGSFGPIIDALTQLQAEFTRRGGAMKKGNPGPWLTVVWDEVPLCIGTIGKFAREMMVKLLSAGRPRKIRLIAGSTSDRVGALGIEGFGDLLESCAVVRLGSFAVAAAPAAGSHDQPTTLELGGKVQVVERGPTLLLAQRPIDPTRVWVATSATSATSVVPVATAQSAPSDGCATTVVGAESTHPDVAQRDWKTVADLVRAGVIKETAALKALGFPPSSTSERYQQARAALKAVLGQASQEEGGIDE